MENDRVNSQLLILKELIFSPKNMSMVVPSTQSLFLEMIRHIDFSDVDTVVELGPGTGSFTRDISGRINDDADFLALEVNTRMHRYLTKRFPQLDIINDDARNVQKYLAMRNKTQADVIISSIPWMSLTIREQIELLKIIHATLSSDGIFVTYSYAHTKLFRIHRQFKTVVKRKFSTVRESRVIWKNFPPAFVYVCRK